MEKISIDSKRIMDWVVLLKNSDFYNKIQITFDFSDSEFKTETFYFFEEEWGHAIFKEKTDGSSEVIQETTTFKDNQKLIDRLSSLEKDTRVIIAGNSKEYTLTVNL